MIELGICPRCQAPELYTQDDGATIECMSCENYWVLG